MARVLRPVIWLLGVSTNFLVKLLGGDPGAGREEVSDEEIRALVSGSSTLGAEERRIVDDVFDAGERSLREVMLPRTEVDFISGDVPAHKAVRELLLANRRDAREIWMAADLDPAPVLSDIRELAAEARVVVKEVALSQGMSGRSQARKAICEASGERRGVA